MGWSVGTAVTGVGGTGFSGAIQLTAGQTSLEGSPDRPVFAGEFYLVTGWVRSLIATTGTGSVGLQCTESGGGSSTVSTPISVTGATWQEYAAIVQVSSTTITGQPFLACATNTLQFANVQFCLALGTLKIANGTITSTVATTILGSIPSSGGLNLTGGSSGSAFWLIGTATITAKDPDGTGVAGDFDVILSSEMVFNQGMAGDFYMCLDYAFSLGSLPDVNAFDTAHLNVNTSVFDFQYVMISGLSALSAGSHTVTVWFKPAINTTANHFVTPKTRVGQRAK